MQQHLEHVMARIGHWLVLALAGVTYAAQRVQPMTADMHNTIQMAMLVLGGTTVAAIVHSAIVQKALAAAGALAKGAGAVQEVASSVAGAITSAQAQAPQVPPKS